MFVFLTQLLGWRSVGWSFGGTEELIAEGSFDITKQESLTIKNVVKSEMKVR